MAWREQAGEAFAISDLVSGTKIASGVVPGFSGLGERR